MSEELEQKLNDLLVIRKQLEEGNEEQQKTAAASVIKRYKNKAMLNWMLFWLKFGLGMALVTFGLVVGQLNSEVFYIDCPTCIVAGLLILFFAQIRFSIIRGQLVILQEMKGSELRIMEMLKK
jgi:hypothetical protein